MDPVLRHWKCRHCSRGNATAIALDGIGTCEHCGNRTSVQPSRIRKGTVLPMTYPTRVGAPGRLVRVRSLGEV